MAFELPEAATVARQMDRELRGKLITRVELSECASLLRQGFINLDRVELAGRIIQQVTWKGKWIYTCLEGDLTFLIALETGGQVLYHPPQHPLPAKWNARLVFEDGSFLTERIIAWGWARALTTAELAVSRYPGIPGLNPVDEEEFTFDRFAAILDAAKGKILRAVLIDQLKIAGIGNGYLQEILFQAGLRPDRKAGSLATYEREGLFRAIYQTLQDALHSGGSDLEVDLYGNPGGYHRLMSERSLAHPCPRCGGKIEKIKVQGGGCYVCNGCQK